jgi:dCMP deaminase
MTTIDRPSWDETWMAVADIVALRSRCSRAGIGAVVVSANNRICSTGYNGPAARYPRNGECIDFCPRAQGKAPLDNTYDQCPSIHSELNALLYVDRSQVEGGTIYVSESMCMSCAKAVSNSGLSRVVMRLRDADKHRKPELVVEYLRSCGMRVSIFSREDVDSLV